MQHAADQFLTAEEAHQFYATGDAAHDFDHVLRVAQLGDRLATAERADRIVVRLAALLHDVPAGAAGGRLEHHMAAAAFARRLLEPRGLGTRKTANVVHCIEAHRFREASIRPQTLEARCLYDADKLDSIGALGIARVFAFAGAHSSRLWTGPAAAAGQIPAPAGADYTPVHEFVFKLSRLLETLHTDAAQAIGGERHRFMVEFFARLDAEATGER